MQLGALRTAEVRYSGVRVEHYRREYQFQQQGLTTSYVY